MNSLFCAESVAVIGVSESGNNMGKNILANLVRFGYQGEIYAIGPRGGELFGYPIYRSVSEVPGSIELAVILTPARFIPELLIQCGEKGTRWAIIETAGFREVGSEGEVPEREIVQASKQYDIRFVGPNCLGVINTANGLYTPFVDYANPYRKGSMAVVSQSGGLANSMPIRLTPKVSSVGVLAH